MMKHIRTFGAAAAALAASAVLLAPALAQQGPGNYPLDGAPGAQNQYQNPQNYRGDRDDQRYDDRNDWNNGDRSRTPEFWRAVSDCSREANRQADRYDFFSAQYEDENVRIVRSRNGVKQLVGRMRLHNRRGYDYANVYCTLGNGRGGVRVEIER